ncbi:tubulin nucleotide-binding domain-like protein [Testicularia cyperi]|uniref:Tubulin nucleotide-binding domain-like protein n=1 Tax=Testicularia cyperi TaxID=1882483 RepID=A0A317XMV1_9BASI|nr:tubulin nucleotide-binding domain-like protein [Testicularia cyperi]
MSQREIVYLSFGSFSNHISTHFWNEQESYFTYDHNAPQSSNVDRASDDNTDDEPLLDHDISFKAGQNLQGQDTYNPRTLIFEVQQEFGSLRKLNALHDSFDRDHELGQLPLESLSTWSAPAHIIAARPTQKSRYQRRLELEDKGLDPGSDSEEDDECDDDCGDDTNGNERSSATSAGPSSLGATSGPSAAEAKQQRQHLARRHRFWSDFSRVYFHPKSLISVGGELLAPMSGSFNAPDDLDDAQDGRTRFETFAHGASFLDELERDQDVLDTNLRWFTEDADLLQGFQYSIDSSTAFGGLGSTYLEHIVDEYPKVSHIALSAAWGDARPSADDNNVPARLTRLRAMNNVLTLAKLAELSSITVPIHPPTSESTLRSNGGRDWTTHLNRANWSDLHHVAALVSTHLETATIGTRLKSRSESLTSLCDRLNWRRDTRIAHLGGCLPVAFPEPLGASAPATSGDLSSDPVDAVLASYGYGSRDTRFRQRGEPVESAADLAARGNKFLLSTWLDLSLPSSLPAQSNKNGNSDEKLRKKLLYQLQNPFATHVVLRNSNLEQLRLGLGMLDKFLKIKEPFGQGVYVPLSYNVPTSYPNYFSGLDASGRAIPPKLHMTNQTPRPKSLPVVSALSTTPSTVYLLREARETLKEAIQGHRPLQAWGLTTSSAEDRDMLKDHREEIENLIDAYTVDNPYEIGGEGALQNEEDQMGTDEEYDIDQKPGDDLDWDL